MFENERRDLAWVPRWSIARVNRRQSVAEHSYFVACYGIGIADYIGWPKRTADAVAYHRQRAELVVYLLRHDEGECVESDIPGPIKRLITNGSRPVQIERLRTMRFGPLDCTEDMRKICKAADLVDECLYLAGEMNGGNGHVGTIFDNARGRLYQAIDALPGKDEYLIGLRQLIDKAIYQEREGEKNIAGLEGV